MTIDDDQVVVATDEKHGGRAFVFESEGKVACVMYLPGATLSQHMPPMRARELGMALLAFADAAEERAS